MSYDPYAAKLAANNATTTNPVQSQYYAPVGTAAAPPGGTVVMPAAQSHGYSHQPGEPVRAPPVAYSQRAPPGRWKDGICDWCNNLYPSCYCACCCFYGMWLVGQSKLPRTFSLFLLGSHGNCLFLVHTVAQKTGFTKFSTVVGSAALFWLIGIILTLATGAGAFILVIPMIYSFVVAIVLRMHIVRTESITETGPFCEFCTAFWCWYCSVAQSKSSCYFATITSNPRCTFSPN
jgi:hypothetical protein